MCGECRVGPASYMRVSRTTSSRATPATDALLPSSRPATARASAASSTRPSAQASRNSSAVGPVALPRVVAPICRASWKPNCSRGANGFDATNDSSGHSGATRSLVTRSTAPVVDTSASSGGAAASASSRVSSSGPTATVPAGDAGGSEVRATHVTSRRSPPALARRSMYQKPAPTATSSAISPVTPRAPGSPQSGGRRHEDRVGEGRECPQEEQVGHDGESADGQRHRVRPRPRVANCPALPP